MCACVCISFHFPPTKTHPMLIAVISSKYVQNKTKKTKRKNIQRQRTEMMDLIEQILNHIGVSVSITLRLNWSKQLVSPLWFFLGGAKSNNHKKNFKKMRIFSHKTDRIQNSRKKKFQFEFDTTDQAHMDAHTHSHTQTLIDKSLSSRIKFYSFFL